MTEAELLELLLLETADMHTTIAMGFSEVAVRQDAAGGYVHLLGAGLGLALCLLTWIAVMVTRR